jgi:hypothetical protein
LHNERNPKDSELFKAAPFSRTEGLGQVPDSEQLQQNNQPAKAWLANNGMSSDVDSRHYA